MIPVAIACPAMARCLGILDDLAVVFGFDPGLPSLEGDRTGLMRDEPGSAWLVVDDAEQLALIVELPVDDTYRFAGSFVDEGIEVEPLGDEVYRVGEYTIADDGPMMLLSRDREALLGELSSGRPEIPSEPNVIAKAWITRDAFPEWMFERFDEIVAARYEAAARAGDQRTMSTLNLLTDTIIDTTDVEVVLREDAEDWVVDAALYPGLDTWALHRTEVNAAPQCPLAALVAEDAAIVGTICERAWARPSDDGSPPVTAGLLSDMWSGFFDPNFVVEGVLSIRLPFTGFAALRMPDAKAASTGLASLYIVMKTGALDLPLTVLPIQTQGDRAVYSMQFDDKDHTMLALTLVDDVALLTFGPDAVADLESLASRIPALTPTPSPRIALRLNLTAGMGQLQDRAGIGRLLGGFDSSLSLAAVDDHDVWSLRLHGRVLHWLATGRDDAKAPTAADLGPGGA